VNGIGPSAIPSARTERRPTRLARRSARRIMAL
jgi:hypothetical protein